MSQQPTLDDLPEYVKLNDTGISINKGRGWSYITLILFVWCLAAIPPVLLFLILGHPYISIISIVIILSIGVAYSLNNLFPSSVVIDFVNRKIQLIGLTGNSFEVQQSEDAPIKAVLTEYLVVRPLTWRLMIESREKQWYVREYTAADMKTQEPDLLVNFINEGLARQVEPEQLLSGMNKQKFQQGQWF